MSWIKVHHDLLNSEILQSGSATQCWLICLLRASHNSKTVLLKRIKLDLTPGQFVMGYQEVGDRLGISKSNVKYWFDYFEREGMIARRTLKTGTVVTVSNWSDYQSLERKENAKRIEQPTQLGFENETLELEENAKRTQKVPNKNIKNNKNTTKVVLEQALKKKKPKIHWSQLPLSSEEIKEIAENFSVSFEATEGVYQALKDYCDANGVNYADYKAALRNFVRRDLQKIKLAMAKGSYGRPTGTVIIPVED